MSSTASKKRAFSGSNGEPQAVAVESVSSLIPAGHNRVMAHLHFSDAPKAIAWYKTVFDAIERVRHWTEDKKHVMHCELQFGETVIMLNDFPTPADIEAGPANASFFLYVDDPDQCHDTAVQNGASSKLKPNDAEYGDRMAMFRDPFGNQWIVSKPLKKAEADENTKKEVEAASKPATVTDSEENKMQVEKAEKNEAAGANSSASIGGSSSSSSATANGQAVAAAQTSAKNESVSSLIPAGHNRVMAHLHFSDAPKAIAWYKTVFDANERVRHWTEDKKHIMHCELQFGESVIMLNDFPTPADIEAGPANASFFLYVDDPDQCHDTAVQNGASSKLKPNDAEYGDRMAMFRDPFGNQWIVSKPLKKPAA